MTRNFIDHNFAVATTIAMCAAMNRKRKPRIVTEAEVNRAHETAKREDWNRSVDARKAAKRQAKSAAGKEGS